MPQITYYLKSRHTFGKMTMEIFNPKGEKIADLSPGKSKGINQVSWNYRLKLPRTAKAKTFAFGGFAAPTVPAGTYKVRVTKGANTYETDLVLQYDPNSIHSAEDHTVQHETAMKLYGMTEDLAYMVDQMDKMKAGADTMITKVNADKKLQKTLGLDAWTKDITALKESVVVTKGDNYVGSAEPQLREKISTVYGEVVSYAGRPTNAQLDNIKVLNDQLNAAKTKLEGLKSKLTTINAALIKAKMGEIKMRSKEEFMKADM